MLSLSPSPELAQTTNQIPHPNPHTETTTFFPDSPSSSPSQEARTHQNSNEQQWLSVLRHVPPPPLSVVADERDPTTPSQGKPPRMVNSDHLQPEHSLSKFPRDEPQDLKTLTVSLHHRDERQQWQPPGTPRASCEQPFDEPTQQPDDRPDSLMRPDNDLALFHHFTYFASKEIHTRETALFSPLVLYTKYEEDSTFVVLARAYVAPVLATTHSMVTISQKCITIAVHNNASK